MSSIAYEVRDGRATYDGRTLAEWVPEIVGALVAVSALEQHWNEKSR